MKRQSWLAVMFGTVLAATLAAGAAAQFDEVGALVIGVTVPVTDRPPDVATRLRNRSYVPLETIRLRFDVTNETREPLRISAAALQAAFRFRVEAAAEVPVAVEWPAVVYLDNSPVPSGAVPVVELTSGKMVAWEAHLRRADGAQFTEGSYTVAWSLNGVRGAVSRVDGAPSPARTQDGGKWTLTLDVRPPETLPEVATRYLLAGHDALAREQYDEAIDAYLSADQVDPVERRGRRFAGVSFVQAGRYLEAIPLLAEEVEQSAVGRNYLPVLALAYVGAGRETDAANALRRYGHSEGEIQHEIEKARAVVKRNQR